jgi:hypothetical protein
VQLFQIQDWRYMRCFGDGSWGLVRLRLLLRLFYSDRPTFSTKVFPHSVREVVIKCTGVRFLVGNSNFRQVVQNDIAFHFQFTCQFVNPNLSHA